jgi:hypothetical protein
MLMSPPRHHAKMILLIVLATGCETTDDRLVRHVAESNRQQAEQNQEMAKVHREVAEGTSRLVEAVAESRQEMLGMEHELQDQRTQLETERRSMANERHRESILAPVLSNVGLMLVAALPLVLCWYLLHGLRSTDDDVSEVLVQNLVDQQWTLPAASPARSAIEHETPPTSVEDPPF